MQTKRRSLLAKSLLLHGPRTLNWHEEMLPAIGDNDLLIETVAGAISIGTEIPRYTAKARSAHVDSYPTMTGYESYGRIIGVGKDVPSQLIGEKVIAFYGHRTHAILPKDRVIFAPSRIPPPTALLLILTCDVAKGIRKLNIQPEERVLVTGAGAIGLMTIWVLKKYGVQTIHVIDPDANRREKAEQLGAISAVHPDDAHGWFEEFTVSIECSSNNNAFQLLQAKSAPAGRICILSDGNLEALTLSPHFHHKELTIIGSSDGWDYQQHALWFWQAALDDTSLADTLFEKTISHRDLIPTFKQLAQGKVKPIKVLVNYYRDK